MHKKPIAVFVIISLMVIIGGIGLSSCAPVAAVQPQSEVETYINTAVSATLVQYLIETKVAAQASQEPAELIAQAQPTETPLPTPTSVPPIVPTATSESPTPTSVPTAVPIPVAAADIQIYADLNTNCRFGPGKTYAISGTFLKGTTSKVHGRDSTKNWWYIVHPSQSGQFCWVWDGSTTIQGDPSGLQVVEAPTVSYVQTSNYYYDDEETHGINPIIMDTPKIHAVSTTTAAAESIQTAAVEIRSSGMILVNVNQPKSRAAPHQSRSSGTPVKPIRINANVEQPGRIHVNNQNAQLLPL